MKPPAHWEVDGIDGRPTREELSEQLLEPLLWFATAEAPRDNPDAERERKLLLNRREIDRLSSKVRERGFTLVPLEMYFRNGRAKVSLALARGKRVYDRRDAIAKREADLRLRRLLKRRTRGR